ncbi:MAG: PLD nuclease N-terminal domain-containing protein [Mobilicoccus sp.]|nr:PLD nuclease N-terminal domain-containing protein [Mobilicoccus sp.]
MLRVVAALALLVFTVYCVIDCAQTPSERVRGLPKAGWIPLIILFPAVGGVAWWIAGRPAPGASGPQDTPRMRGPLGPDDDPDFLGRL